MINYKYTIVSQDVAAKCMEIRYEAEGYGPMHIGAPLPAIGQDVMEIVRAYAPIQAWLDSVREVQPVVVGASGEVAPITTDAPVDTQVQAFAALEAAKIKAIVEEVLDQRSQGAI